MRETTQEVIDAMRSNVITTSAKIVIVDNEYNTAIITEQAIYTIFEGNGINLDGSECLLCKTDVYEGIPQLETGFERAVDEGWYSSILSDENGNIEVTHTDNVKNSKETEQTNLHIIFSDLRNEYAVNFTVTVTNNEETQVYTFTNNMKNKITIGNVNANCIVTIKVTKWSKSYSRVKILNVYTDEIYRYEDEDIISIKCKKGVDLLNEEIESKDIEIKLVDKDNKYNIFDSNSELAQLNSSARILIYIGVLIDNFIYYIKIDECYFKEIKKEDNELEMIVNAEGIISKYQDVEWEKLYSEIYFYENTLEQIINEIDETYEELRDKIKIQNLLREEGQEMKKCFEKEKKIHDYLKYLSTNCRSNLVETYNNEILFTRLQEKEPATRINIENMQEYPQLEKQNEFYNIIVKKYDYSASENVEEVYYGKFAVNQYGDASIYPYKHIEFLTSDNYEFLLNIYNKDGSVYKKNITSESGQPFALGILPNKIVFVVNNTLKDKTYELTMKCKTLQFTNTEYEINCDKKTEQEKNIDIRSIQDIDTAKKVANWLKGNLKKKYLYKIKVNDVFTYELGDTVEVETGIYNENNQMIIKKAIIVGIEYEYDGALDYYLILKGE